MKFKKIS